MEPPGGLLTVVQFVVYLAASALVLGAKIPRKALWAVAAVSFALFGWIVFTMSWNYHDAEDFWRAGRAAWTGLFPYYDPCACYPPPGVGVFALFAWLPKPLFMAVWRLLAASSFAGAVFAARAALGKDNPLHRSDLALLASAVALSVSVRAALGTMSSTFLTLMLMIAAVACRDRGRPIAAGVLLALGCPKITTMIPFLSLWLRKRDWKTWAAVGIVGLVLTFIAVRPGDLFPGLRKNLQNIRDIGAEGRENDFSFANDPHNSTDIISLEHALYHLGIRNRGIVKGGAALATLLLGAWVLRQVWRNPALPHAAAVSVVACYSTLFVYHRIYDMTILVLPLVYAAGKGRSESGRIRWLYRGCAFAILWILYLRLSRIVTLASFAQKPGFLNRIVEATVLPQAVWILLGVLIVLTIAERRAASSAPPPQALPEAR